eukprot:1144923-Pelagomonas_calceolata.AAC.9
MEPSDKQGTCSSSSPSLSASSLAAVAWDVKDTTSSSMRACRRVGKHTTMLRSRQEREPPGTLCP